MRNAETILDIIRQRHGSLESRLEIERLISGLEGAVGKVLNRVTRWPPTLPQGPFLGGGCGSNAASLPD